MNNNKKLLFVISILILSSIVLAACGSSTTPTTNATSPSGVADGKTLLNERCTGCHSINQVTRVKGTEAQWQAEVANMVQRGAKLTAEEQQVLVAYLAANYGQ